VRPGRPVFERVLRKVGARMSSTRSKRDFFTGRAAFAVISSAAVLAVSIFLFSGQAYSRDVEQREIKQKAVKEKAIDPGSVFRAIERAWKRGDAAEMSRHVGTGRVYLDIYGANRKGGYFSKPQVYFLFKRHFSTTRQLKFSFLRLSKPKLRSSKAFGIARRVFRDVRSGRVINDKVYVTLRREGKKWVLSEVKSMK